MMHSFKFLAAATVLAGVAIGPTVSQAESSKSDKSGKAAAASASKNSQAAGDDFEENRRLHTQKSKENNAKKGEN